jgi:predicted TIM-barrel fold metal-dependent hydrolase
VVGSDWPVGEKGASLKNIFDLPRAFLETKSPEERANVFSGNAKDFYVKM